MERDLLIHLVTQAQKGNSSAMDELFTHYYNDVYYFALKTVKNSDIACDITQETFLEIIRTIGNLKEPVAFVTWMKQITYHQCTRYFKKKKDVQFEEDEDGNSVLDNIADESIDSIPEEVYEKAEFRETILNIIHQLTEEQRSAILLYYFDELSVGQIAEIQGVSEGTVKSRLNYARKAIKKSVETYEEKYNVKLHSFSFLPLFMLFFGQETMPVAKAETIRAVVANSASAAGTAAAGAGAVGSAYGVGNATTGSSVAAKAVFGGLLAKLLKTPMLVKLLVGVFTALLAIVIAVVAITGGFETGLDWENDASWEDSDPSEEEGENDGDNDQSVVGAPLYNSDLIRVHEVSYLVRNKIKNIRVWNAISIETTDGGLYSLDNKTYSIDSFEGEDIYSFYDCYVYTNSEGKIAIGNRLNQPRYTIDAIQGEILYCVLPENYGGRTAMLYTFEDGQLYCTQITENGVDRKSQVELKYYDFSDSENSGYKSISSDTFASVVSLSASGLNSHVVHLAGLPMIYVKTTDNFWWEVSLYALYEDEDGSFLDARCLNDSIPNQNSNFLAYSIGTSSRIPLFSNTSTDTSVYCVNEWTACMEYKLPEGYTVENIQSAYSGKTILLLMDDGTVYSTRSDSSSAFVLQEELSSLYGGGHIQSILDARDTVVFLADDGFIYTMEMTTSN